MTTTLRHTVLPPSEVGDNAQVAALADLLASTGQTGHAKLIGPDGAEVELPAELYRLIREVAEALAQGKGVTVAPHDALLTTQEAADLLGISRPTLVRLLTDDEIPYELRGRHRRVRLADVVDYLDRMRADRRRALNEMTRLAHQDGSDEIVIEDLQTR
ncbi:DNA-binding protein [Amycolatopsis antarctica]|uniref:DNA-binding protein n=1 Tax=Amycolatopsis antarctica TaxID=1854586 RepID=A0A263CZ24_9PSEU|nr:helix-turn-helix domain-containing protein [Amycolatopsis antarctica]OZM71361.1 DNA-binding protein [Amycolatopsis antarctica]